MLDKMETAPQKPLYGRIRRCQICFGPNLKIILSLGHQPPVHSHVTAEKLHEPEITYPLNFCRCSRCGLLQLDYAVDPKILFSREYPYLTGMTKMLVRNFRELTSLLSERYRLAPRDLAIDIGSNDGTLLKGFREKGIRVLGVEPTQAARAAIKDGIPTLQNFFTKKAASAIRKKHGKAKIITATNIFAHVNNLFEFLAGIRELLTDDGVFVSESQYLLDIIEKLEFDTIYHEHLRFYSLKPLVKLFTLAGLNLVDAERISVAGGSIRVYATKGKERSSRRVRDIIRREVITGLYDQKRLKSFASKARSAKHKLLALILECKKRGARIVGIGAPARSNTLLGFAKIDSDVLDYNAERKGSPKIGLFTPGTHIPVVDEARVFREQPEYALVLSWHIGGELIKKLRESGYRGKFIMPLPEPRIIS